MRLWSLHPKYLDPSGLVALWREGLGAKKAIEYFARGEKCGYQNHPQLKRFYEQEDKGVRAINTFLFHVLQESKKRKYKFNATKIDMHLINDKLKIKVKTGQVKFESKHLNTKIQNRSPLFALVGKSVELNPLFTVTSETEIEDWEKV